MFTGAVAGPVLRANAIVDGPGAGAVTVIIPYSLVAEPVARSLVSLPIAAFSHNKAREGPYPSCPGSRASIP